MIKRLLIPLFLLGALLLAAPAAQAKVVVGLGDQKAGTFDNQLWKDLRLKKVRYLTPWNVAQDPAQLPELDGFMTRAAAARQEVLVHFTAVRGCFDGKYSKAKECRLPSVKAYTSAFKAFKKRYPKIKVYGTWNEANHVSQPTFKNPKRAAQYYKALKKNCKKCKVIAGDLLDSSNMRSYARAMLRTTGSKARLWGLHNYSDTNRFRSKGTSTLLKTVPGDVWITESGGISIFEGSNLKPSEAKAKRAMRYLFTLANRYDSRTRGNKSRITRLYPYDFGPTPAGSRFDASMLRPDGTARGTYDEFKKGARRAGK